MLILVLLLQTVFAMAGGPDAPAPDTIGIQRGTSLTVATVNTMSGSFSTEMFGSNTADMDVRSLLHGAETVAWTDERSLQLNGTVISHVEAADAAEGTVEYTVAFKRDLRYSDGSPITAADYAFYYLLSGAPEIAEIGGMPLGLEHIVGYKEYAEGKAKLISGVRLLSEYEMKLVMRASAFPYFYGLALAISRPFPISQIAPGCEVADDGQGVYIRNIDPQATEPLFTAALLEKTMLDPDTGYVTHPKVSSGPYKLEGYDKEKNIATFVVNEYFPGNYEGQKPHIERLTFLQMPEERMLDAFFAGEADLLNKITDGTMREGIQGRRRPDETMASLDSYLRTGFVFLSFACESSPASSLAVRKAIAMSIDKDEVLREVMRQPSGANVGSARRVYGYYGLGQWMTGYRTSEADEKAGEEPIDMLESLAVLDVPADLAGAAALLASDGWTLNGQGEAFRPGEDTVRWRLTEGKLEPLMIHWAYGEESAVGEVIRAALEKTWPELGIGQEVTVLPFPELLAHYYRQTPRTYDMFFLASNFSYIFDPYYDFNTAEEYQGMLNTTGLKDQALMELARDMRETEPKNKREYLDKWFVFQKRFVEMMPMVPLYSNVYFDVYTDRLEGYDINRTSGWGYAVVYAYMKDE